LFLAVILILRLRPLLLHLICQVLIEAV